MSFCFNWQQCSTPTRHLFFRSTTSRIHLIRRASAAATAFLCKFNAHTKRFFKSHENPTQVLCKMWLDFYFSEVPEHETSNACTYRRQPDVIFHRKKWFSPARSCEWGIKCMAVAVSGVLPPVPNRQLHWRLIGWFLVECMHVYNGEPVVQLRMRLDMNDPKRLHVRHRHHHNMHCVRMLAVTFTNFHFAYTRHGIYVMSRVCYHY